MLQRFGQRIRGTRDSQFELRVETLEVRLMLSLASDPEFAMPTASPPLAVALGVLDAGSRADLVALQADGTIAIGSNSDGDVWRSVRTIDLGLGPAVGMQRMRFDADAYPDLIVQTPDAVVMARGDGLGNFTIGSAWPADAAGDLAPSSAARVILDTGFFNDDLWIDLVTVSPQTDEVLVFFGGAAGVLGEPLRLASAVAEPVVVAAGDLIGAAAADLVVGHIGGLIASWEGNGVGGFAYRSDLTTAATGTVVDLELADVDGDGDLDVVVSGGSQVTVLSSADDPQPFPVLSNGDFARGLQGWETEIVGHSAGGIPGSVTALGGQARLTENGSFLVSLQRGFTVPAGALSLAFDLAAVGLEPGGGGIPDAFEVSLLDGTGASLVPVHRSGATSFFNASWGASSLASGVTFDGRTVTLDLSGLAPGTAATLYFDLIGNPPGSSSFVAIDAVRVATGMTYDDSRTAMPLAGPFVAAAGLDSGDVDGDGRLDLVVVDASADRLVVFNGDGAGGFVRSELDLSGRGSSPHDVSIAPLSAGDEIADVAIAMFGSSSLLTPVLFDGDAPYVLSTAPDLAAGEWSESLTQIAIVFSEPLVDLGPSAQHSASNPLAYELRHTGTGALVDWSSVQYDPLTATVALGIAPSVLVDGDYLLSIAGADPQWGLVDVGGNRLLGGADSTFAFRLNAVGPEWQATADLAGVEGTAVDLLADFADPGGVGPYTATIDWGDDFLEVVPVVFADNAGSIAASHHYADNGNYAISIAVADSLSRIDSLPVVASIANVPPRLNVASDREAVVGELLDLIVATAFDPGFANPLSAAAETLAAWIDWGDGSPGEWGIATLQNGGPGVETFAEFRGTHSFSSVGTFVVAVTVYDDDGGFASANFAVDVQAGHEPPTVSADDVAGNEGSSVAVQAAFRDTETTGVFTAWIDWGDGQGQPGTVSYAGGFGTVSATHVYADNGDYVVTVSVTDPTGAVGTTAAIASISNVAPSVTPREDTTIYATNEAFLELGTFFDPGFSSAIAETVETFTALVDWGDGTQSSATIDLGVGAPSSGRIHSTRGFAAGQYTVTITVLDDDGASGTAAFVLTVEPEMATPTKFYVVNANGQAGVYRFDAQGAPVGSFGLATSKPRGVTTWRDGDRLWVVDKNKSIFVYDSASDLLLGSWQPKGIKHPEGIATDGEDIWVVDDFSDRVYYYRKSAGRLAGSRQPNDSFELYCTNRHPTGITTDGQLFWVTDAVDNFVYVYTMSGCFLGRWQLDPQNSHPSGITVNPAGGNDLWVVDRQDDQVFHYPQGKLWRWGCREASGGFELPPDVQHPEGIADPLFVGWFDQISTGTITAGEPDDWVFATSAGQQVFLDFQSLDAGVLDITLTGPAGTILVGTTSTEHLLDYGPLGLESGQYVLSITARDGLTPGYSFVMWDVPAADAGFTAIGGAPLEGEIDNPGFADEWSFSAAAGTWVALDTQLAATGESIGYRLVAPNGEVTAMRAPLAAAPFLLGQSGTYRLVVHYLGDGTGPYRVQIVESSAPAVGDPLDLEALIELADGAEAIWRGTTFNRQTRVLLAELELVNSGNELLHAPVFARISAIDPPSVGIESPELVDSQGRPYFVWDSELSGGRLGPGESSAAIPLRIGNPSRDRFRPEVTLLKGANRDPVFVSSPPTVAAVGAVWSYGASAMDLDGDPLTYSVVYGPEGLAIDPTSGEVTWIPTGDQESGWSVRLGADDGRGGKAFQTFQLTVADTAPMNAAPLFVTQPPLDYARRSDVPGQSITLNAVIRDIQVAHPDFEDAITDLVQGIVQGTLGADKTPVFAGPNGRGWVNNAGTFYQWFHDVPGVNLTTVAPITLNETSPGSGIYDFLDLEFFPIDFQLFGNEGLAHNFHFTVEMHSEFVYRGGEVLQFTGDDDNWVFINDQLVIDMGGVHDLMTMTLSLDTLGLTVGETYDIDMFFAERHTTGKYFGMQTGMALQPNVVYSYDPDAIDPEGDAVTYSLLDSPNGMAIDAHSGLVTWNPATDQIRQHAVQLAATDSQGNSETQSFVVTVSGPVANRDPVFESSPLVRVNLGESWDYEVRADDADLDVVTFQLLSGPAGMAIDARTGQATWTPTSADLGTHDVAILARDGVGGESTQAFQVAVTAAQNNSPQLTSAPVTGGAVGVVYLYPLAASDPDGDRLTFELEAGPAGMVLAADAGVLAWRPTPAQTGSHDVAVVVRDPYGASARHDFQITVSSGDAGPSILSRPPDVASVDELYTYVVQAIGGAAGAMTYRLDEGPTAAALDSITGKLTWTPAETDAGAHRLTVRATDAAGAVARQTFVLSVFPDNDAPEFVSTPLESTAFGHAYYYDAHAVDSEDDVAYRLVNGPTAASLDPRTGQLVWTPNAGDIGAEFDFLVRATDARGLWADQLFTVQVLADATPPNVGILTSRTVIELGESVVVSIAAEDDVAIGSLAVTVNGSPVAPDANRQVVVTGTAAGRVAIEAVATDASGNSTTATREFRVVDPADTSAPLVSFTSPLPSATITYLADVVGSVAADDLETYWLEYSWVGADEWTRIGEGSQERTAETLAQFDPTLLPNDAYLLRLSAQDFSGNLATTTIQVTVDGGAKVGNYSLEFTDVSLPLAGIPLRITRRYDTLFALFSGDFGYGWRMAIADGGIRESLPISQAELDGVPPLFGGAAGFYQGTRVFITAPDGQRLAYRFEPVPTGGLLGTVWHPRFVAENGSAYQLVVDDVALSQNTDGTFGLFLIGGSYNPRAYTLVAKDQIRYVFDQFQGLRSATDRNGVTLEYRSDGIYSSTGPAITWERDAASRITRIVTPDGNSVRYQYDARGDLIRFTDAVDNAYAMEYRAAPAHYLERISGPRGHVLNEVQYDAAGRFVAVVDAAGNAIQQSYALADHAYSQTDRLGNVTTLVFDDLGNILQIVDPLGQITSATYDDPRFPRRETSVTDARGFVTQFEYDARGNLARILETDRVTTIRYNDRNDIVQIEGPSPLNPPPGYVAPILEMEYDAAGNLVAQTNAAGETSSYQNDAWGRLTSQTDPLGRTTQYVYDGFAHPGEIHFPDGAVRTMARNAMGLFSETANELGDRVQFLRNAAGQPLGFVDALGNTLQNEFEGALLVRTTDTLGRTTELQYDSLDRLIRIVDPAGGVVTRQYDANNQLIHSTNQAGQTESWTYNANGDVATYTDAAGNVTSFVYDAVGSLVEVVNARGFSTRFEYDAYRRLITSTDPLGGVVSYAYDAQDRVVSAIDRRGNQTRYHYDAVGRLVATIDSLGQVRNWAYDAAGNLVAATDARGNSTLFEYDERDRLARQVDAAGFVQEWQYDLAGRMTRYIDASGGSFTYRYDANHQLRESEDPTNSVHVYTYDPAGNRTSATDPLGRVSRWTYDALDRVVSAENPAGGITEFEYDSVGNLLRLVDPQNNATTWAYDAANRVVGRTDPLGQSASFAYDAVGNLTQRTDRLGRITQFAYDPLDRVTSETWRTNDGSPLQSFAYAYDPNDNLIEAGDANARYTFVYDSLDRVTRVDNAGSLLSPHFVLDYTYDAEGNVTRVADGGGVSITAQFDARNLLSAQVWSGPAGLTGRIEFDHDGRGLASAIRRYDDGAGLNLISRSDHVFDALGRIESIVHSNGSGAEVAAYLFQFDAAGQMTRQVVNGEVSDYTYDPVGQLTSAAHDTQPDEAYHYDANGNRLAAEIVVGPNNQLLADATFDYVYDAEGNLVRKTERSSGKSTLFAYDHRNRLVLAERYSAGGILLSESSFAYDVFDRLIGRTVDADGAGPTAAETMRTVYDGQNAWADFDSVGNVVARYLFGERLDQNLARWRPGEGVVWYLTDQLGSIRDLVDATGAAIDRITYDSFGGIVLETNPAAGDRFKYTGREWQPELALYYFRARFYDPASGRFVSQDPLGFAAGDANLHRYVGNSPLTYVDPTGTSVEGATTFLMSRQFTAIASGVLGSAVGYFCAYLDAWYEAEGSPYQELQAHAAAVIGSAVGFSLGVGIGLVTSGVAAGSATATGLAGFFTGLGTGFNLINIANAKNQEIRSVRITCFLAEIATGALGGVSRGAFRRFMADESGTLRIGYVPRTLWRQDTIPEGRRLVTYYPANRGFVGDPVDETLLPGTIIDRFGFEGGTFAAPQGTPSAMRALPPGTTDRPYNAYEVLQPLLVKSGHALPWFQQPGLGTQFELPATISELLQLGFLRRLPQ